MRYFYDFHIHSCLSPCGSPDMTPSNIARMAALSGYAVIAVSDHNTTGNCRSVVKAAEDSGILAVPAMELTTSEEVHILCLLPDPDAADAFGKYVRDRLPKMRNRADFFGEQLFMDEDDMILGREELLLQNAASISISETPSLLRSFGGVAIPAHIDRGSFSVFSNLGFFDRSLGFEAVEVTRRCDTAEFLALHPEMADMPWMINSDAHDLMSILDPAYTIGLPLLSTKNVIEAVRTGRLSGIFSEFG